MSAHGVSSEQWQRRNTGYKPYANSEYGCEDPVTASEAATVGKGGSAREDYGFEQCTDIVRSNVCDDIHSDCGRLSKGLSEECINKANDDDKEAEFQSCDGACGRTDAIDGESSAPRTGDNERANGNRSSPDNDDPNNAMCRICLDSADAHDENGRSLGRLIAPCRCRGTMKCGAAYRFRRTLLLQIVMSPFALFGVTVVLFFQLVWFCGALGMATLAYWEPKISFMSPFSLSSSPVASENYDDREYKGQRTEGSLFRGQLPTYDAFWYNSEPGLYHSQSYDPHTESLYHSLSSYDSSYVEPSGYFHLIGDLVSNIISGGSADMLQVLNGDSTGHNVDNGEKDDLHDDERIDSVKENFHVKGVRETVLHEREHCNLPQSQQLSQNRRGLGPDNQLSTSSCASSQKDSSIQRGQRYDARNARELGPNEGSPRRQRKARIQPMLQPKWLRQNTARQQRYWTTWVEKVVMQLSLGLLLVGIFSLFNMLVGVTFFGPFHLGNLGINVSFLSLRRRISARAGGRITHSDSVIFVLLGVAFLILLIFGIFRALYALFRRVRRLASFMLARVEDYIVDS